MKDYEKKGEILKKGKDDFERCKQVFKRFEAFLVFLTL